MYLQIREIILWPRNPTFEPRRLKFETGMVNVISGASRTGKSAVIPIIDYCLGSGTCSVPVNTIRNACSWFGVIIALPQGEMLLARREPGAQQSTDDMFVIQQPKIIDVPATIKRNTSADAVRRTLDEQAGLTMLDFAAHGEASGFEGRPSFRDMAAFTFQPQNVVANPDVLYFKTSSYEHREKLRKIFPYVLGAVTPELLAKQHELRRIQGELRRKQRELSTVEHVSTRWLAELRALMSEARELGLLTISDAAALPRNEMIEALRLVVSRPQALPSVSQASIKDALSELADLEREESEASLALTTLRRRLEEMRRIEVATVAHADARRIQRERLQISTWLADHRSGDESCPICGNSLDTADATLAQLHEALREFEDSAGTAEDVPAAFDRELQRVSAEVTTAVERLKGIQIRKQALSKRSSEAQSLQFQVQKAERFAGNVEHALQLHERLGEDSELRAEVESLQERERALIAELRAQNIEDRKQRALDSVNLLAGRLLPHLDAEYPDAPVSLQIDDLSIKIIRPGREDLLSEVGSGSNWLSYHIATLLALHQFLISLPHSPVPTFLIMDQPSQVYFPKRLVVRDWEPEEEPSLRDEDIEAVQKAFRVMADVVQAAKDQLQIIVLDHAPRDVWGDIPGVHEVEEWRGSQKLVPLAWLESSTRSDT